MRYHRIAIALHWIMAVAFVLMLASGLSMSNMEMEKSLQFRLYQWHKSLGVLLLCSFFLRLLVRLLAAKPALPATIKPREQTLAKLGHWALYGWMIALPMTGWIMVSASVYGLPTIVFGWFEWPHIAGIAGDKAISEAAGEAHELLAFSFIALIAVHIAAVVKHYAKDGVNLLPRMGIGK